MPFVGLCQDVFKHDGVYKYSTGFPALRGTYYALPFELVHNLAGTIVADGETALQGGYRCLVGCV